MRHLIFGLATTLFLMPDGFAWAQVPEPSRVVVFGDSLCDNGNLLFETGPDAFPFGGDDPPPLFPFEFYPTGRLTNGLLWTENLAPTLGLSVPQPAFVGGTTFAVGGAETGFGISQRLTPNVGEQIGLASLLTTLNEHDLIVLWAGSNDFTPIPPATFPASQAIVANVKLHIEQLHALGGQVFLVPNLPPLGDTPQGSAEGPVVKALLNLIALDYNLRLESALRQLEAELDITIFRFNTFGLIRKIVADPQSAGFLNSTEPAFDLESLTVVPDEVQDLYVFWDTIHPTRAGHRVLGLVGAASVISQRTSIALAPNADAPIGIGGWLSGLQRSLLLLRLDLATFELGRGELSSAKNLLTQAQNQLLFLVSTGRMDLEDGAPLLADLSVALDAIDELSP